MLFSIIGIGVVALLDEVDGKSEKSSAAFII